MASGNSTLACKWSFLLLLLSSSKDYEQVLNDKKTDQYKEEVKKFYDLGKRYTHLLSKEGDENKSYRTFAKQIFIELFRYAKVEIPSDPILEELVTNCNQAGYEGALPIQISFGFGKYNLISTNPVKVINIDCTDINHITIKSDMAIPIVEFDNPEKKLSELDSSLEFTLQSQDGKDDVIYKDGKLSLTVPRKLRDYKTDGISLFDIIKEYFYKFCEKLGFKFEVEIEHDLGDPMSYLEEVALPIHSNEHENTP
ncbi:hypothetical protein JSQ73_000490 [Wolbachia endosymbiont of Anopheles demeilloni]|uniref:hypothetical protein n=1 Tax=Wolbachia endosymbiont of Anopheles demeilloni TaxID=2748871 RepID=UPI001F3A3921|nr:hypothetical protein [Wolbachia endosymbiont of Anopheles demeilloni]UIP93354.1 hypothetical protein JSQ73_000490 [Wolbachia endosymbiont of Anopheles demeilloni]